MRASRKQAEAAPAAAARAEARRRGGGGGRRRFVGASAATQSAVLETVAVAVDAAAAGETLSDEPKKRGRGRPKKARTEAEQRFVDLKAKKRAAPSAPFETTARAGEARRRVSRVSRRRLLAQVADRRGGCLEKAARAGRGGRERERCREGESARSILRRRGSGGDARRLVAPRRDRVAARERPVLAVRTTRRFLSGFSAGRGVRRLACAAERRGGAPRGVNGRGSNARRFCVWGGKRARRAAAE